MKTVKTIIKEIETRKNNKEMTNYKFDWNKAADRNRLEWKLDRELAKLSKIQETLNLK